VRKGQDPPKEPNPFIINVLRYFDQCDPVLNVWCARMPPSAERPPGCSLRETCSDDLLKINSGKTGSVRLAL